MLNVFHRRQFLTTTASGVALAATSIGRTLQAAEPMTIARQGKSSSPSSAPRHPRPLSFMQLPS